MPKHLTMLSCSVWDRQESVLFEGSGSKEFVPGVTKWADLLNLRITCLNAAGPPAHYGVRPVSIGFICTADRRADGHMRCRADHEHGRVRATVATLHVLAVHACLPCSINGLRSV